MKLLEGKTVLVTGASTGIGRAAAIGAAQHGADVAINYAHSDGPAQSCVEAIEALGQRAIAVKGEKQFCLEQGKYLTGPRGKCFPDPRKTTVIVHK